MDKPVLNNSDKEVWTLIRITEIFVKAELDFEATKRIFEYLHNRFVRKTP